MENKLITLNEMLPLQETVYSTGGSYLIRYFACLVILAEMAVSKADDFPWLIEDKFNNRRNSCELDKHLQNMLLCLDGNNRVSAKCIECGNSNYYKTEMILDNSIYVHFCRDFNKNSKYNHNYIEMNKDSSELRFCCFEYTLSKDKTTVTGISLLIPQPEEKDIKFKLPIDLTAIRKELKDADVTIEDWLKGLSWYDKQTSNITADNTI